MGSADMHAEEATMESLAVHLAARGLDETEVAAAATCNTELLFGV